MNRDGSTIRGRFTRARYRLGRLAFAVGAVLLAAGCVSPEVRKGRRALDEGAYEEAARHLRIAAEKQPSDVERWMSLGRAEMLAGHPAPARDAFARAAALDPSDPEPRIRIGMAWEMDRRYDEADLAYRQSTEIAPNDPRPHRVRGSRLLRWGASEDAIGPLRRAVLLDPDSAETWNALALANYLAGRRIESERIFRKASRRHPDHLGLRLGLAALLVNGRRYAEALATYEEVVARFPRFAPAHVGRALLLHELGRRDDAERALEMSVKVAEDPRTYRANLERYRRREKL